MTTELAQQRDYVLERLLEIYRPDGAAIWMRSPNPMLDGAIPDELIAAGAGLRVLAVIEALAGGAFW